MQSDLGGEALFTNSAQCLFPYVGVRRTNQEKRGSGTGAGLEARVKIKLSMMDKPFRGTSRFDSRFMRSGMWKSTSCVYGDDFGMEMKGVIPLRRCRERNRRKATAREKGGLMQVTAAYSTEYRAVGFLYRWYMSRPDM